jgi:hypothetical protein
MKIVRKEPDVFNEARAVHSRTKPRSCCRRVIVDHNLTPLYDQRSDFLEAVDGKGHKVALSDSMRLEMYRMIHEGIVSVAYKK